MAPKFEIVNDSYRTPETHGRLKSEYVKILLDGQTIFVPLVDGASRSYLSQFYSVALKHNKRFHQQQRIINDIAGMVCWFSESFSNSI